MVLHLHAPLLPAYEGDNDTFAGNKLQLGGMWLLACLPSACGNNTSYPIRPSQGFAQNKFMKCFIIQTLGANNSEKPVLKARRFGCAQEVFAEAQPCFRPLSWAPATQSMWLSYLSKFSSVPCNLDTGRRDSAGWRVEMEWLWYRPPGVLLVLLSLLTAGASCGVAFPHSTDRCCLLSSLHFAEWKKKQPLPKLLSSRGPGRIVDRRIKT